MIQLSARHKSDDHLWFSFFHEAAHVLLHSKKSVFVDELNGGGTDLEGDFMLAGPLPSGANDIGRDGFPLARE